MRHLYPGSVLALGLSLALSGCVADAARLSGRAVAMLQHSRVAALTGPDKRYVNRLEDAITEMKGQRPDVRDNIGLLLALDELAEIYTFRLVHFEKAAQVNAEAGEILNAIKATGSIDRLGWFFNHKRGLYATIGPFAPGPFAPVALTEGRWSQQSRSFIWIGPQREPLRSIYPESFLRAIADRDVALAAERITRRRSILAKLSSLGEEDQSSRLGSSASGLNLENELGLFELSLASVPEPYRSAVLLERVWALRAETIRQHAFAKVAELGARFVTTETAAYREAHPREAALVRLRTAAALLELGQFVNGMSLVEEAQLLLKRHELNLISRTTG